MKTGKHPHAVLAMHAFSLEECGEYGRAEQAARAALVLSPLDARAQYVGFVGDGGYDHPEFWEPAGGQWLQGEGRRGPRYVEQIGVASGAVVQTRFGNAMRMLGHQPAMHMSWVGGRCLVPLGRAPPAGRGRMGSGGAHCVAPRFSLG